MGPGWGFGHALSPQPGGAFHTLVIHGTADAVISFPHGAALLAAVRGSKRHLWVPGAGHNDLPEVAGPVYWAALREFSELCAAPGGAKR